MPMISRAHKKLLSLMEKRGFQWLDRSRNKHVKLEIFCPNGESFLWVFASTPSCNDAWQRETATLKRLLKQSGYPDERRYLRVSNAHDPRAVEMNLIYDFLDAIANESQEVEGDGDA